VKPLGITKYGVFTLAGGVWASNLQKNASEVPFSAYVLTPAAPLGVKNAIAQKVRPGSCVPGAGTFCS